MFETKQFQTENSVKLPTISMVIAFTFIPRNVRNRFLEATLPYYNFTDANVYKDILIYCT